MTKLKGAGRVRAVLTKMDLGQVKILVAEKRIRLRGATCAEIDFSAAMRLRIPDEERLRPQVEKICLSCI